MPYPTKPDTTIAVGDRVRTYDFEGIDNCYLEGVVKAFHTMEGCQRYKVEVDRVVFEGKPEGVPKPILHVYPPVNGTPHAWSDKICMGVEKLS